MARRARRKRPIEYSILYTATLCLLAGGAVMVYSASSAESLLSGTGDASYYLKRYVLLGLTADKHKRRDEERAAYLKALELDPNHAAAMNNLAAMDLNRGRLGRAARQVTAALQIDPHEEVLRTNLDQIALRARPSASSRSSRTPRSPGSRCATFHVVRADICAAYRAG